MIIHMIDSLSDYGNATTVSFQDFFLGRENGFA